MIDANKALEEIPLFDWGSGFIPAKTNVSSFQESRPVAKTETENPDLQDVLDSPTSEGIAPSAFTNNRRIIMLPEAKGISPQSDIGDFIDGVTTIGAGVLRIPIDMVTTFAKAYDAGESVGEEGLLNSFLEKAEASSREFIEKHSGEAGAKFIGGIKMRTVAESSAHLGYTFSSLLAGLGTGLSTGGLTTLITGNPVLGGATGYFSGSASSASLAYRASKHEFTNSIYEMGNANAQQAHGRDMTYSEWAALKATYEKNAVRYGLYEAAFETMGDVFVVGKFFGGKVLAKSVVQSTLKKWMPSAAAKMLGIEATEAVGKRLVTKKTAEQLAKKIGPEKVLKSIAQIEGFELLTEMLTQMGQSAEEKKAGLREKSSSALEAIQEVFFPVTLQTLLLGAGASGVRKLRDIGKNKGKAAASSSQEKESEFTLLDSLSSGESSSPISQFVDREISIPVEDAVPTATPNITNSQAAKEPRSDIPARVKQLAAGIKGLDAEIKSAEKLESVKQGGVKKEGVTKKQVQLKKVTQSIQDLRKKSKLLKSDNRSSKVIDEQLVKALERRKELEDGILDIKTRIEPPTSTQAAQKITKLKDQRAQQEFAQLELLTTPEENIADIDLGGKQVLIRADKIRKLERDVVTEKFKSLKRGLQLGTKHALDEARRIQGFLGGVIRKSALTDTQKKGFQALLKNVQTVKDFKKREPEIRTRIASLEEATAQRLNRALITKLLKSKVLSPSAGRKGNKDPGSQKQLSALKQLFLKKRKKGVVEAEYAKALTEFAKSPESSEAYFKAQVLGARANKLSAQQLATLYKNIAQVLNDGRNAFDTWLGERKAADRVNIDTVLEQVSGGVKVGGNSSVGRAKPFSVGNWKQRVGARMATFGKHWVFSWDTMLDVLDTFGEREVNTRGKVWGVLNNHKGAINERFGIQKKTEKAQNMAFIAYGIKSPHKLYRKFNQDQITKTLGTFTNANGEQVTLEFTRAEARKRWMELQDPSLEKAFFGTTLNGGGMAYTQEITTAIDTFLTPKDKHFAALQFDFYREYFKEVNGAYRKQFFADLPFNSMYSPILRSGYKRPPDSPSELSRFSILQSEASMRAGISTSLTSRVSNRNPIVEQSDITVLQNHIANMEHFVHQSEQNRKISAVMNNGEVRNAIETRFDKNFMRVIDNFVTDFKAGSLVRHQAMGILDKWRRNYVVSQLMFKANIGVKQLTSVLAFSETIPTTEFVKGMSEMLGSPQKFNAAMGVLRESKFIQTRGNQDTLDFQMAANSAEYQSLAKSGFTNLRQWGLVFGRLGDRVPIYVGGYAVYRYHRSLGKSKAAAIHEMEVVANTTQQSSDLSQLSEAFRRGDALTKSLFMFRNSLVQYMNKELQAVRGAISGNVSLKQAGKVLAIYHVALPMLFQWVANGFEWDLEDEAHAAILGPFNGLAIAGELLDYTANLIANKTVNAVTGGEAKFEPFPPGNTFYIDGLGGLTQIIKGFGEALTSEGDQGSEADNIIDVMKSYRALAGLLGSVVGVGLKAPIDIAEGAKLVYEGTHEQGVKQLLGYSPVIATKGENFDAGF
jgi:hypothetical protein